MASSLSLHSLLDGDKIMEPNFDNWYRKLRIVLKHERILYVIIDLALEVTAPNADAMVRDTYQKWLNDCMTVRYIMRAAMSDEFSYKFVDARSKEILQMLNKFFGILEDLSSIGDQSSKRGRKCKVQNYRANPKQSKIEIDESRKRNQ